MKIRWFQRRRHNTVLNTFKCKKKALELGECTQQLILLLFFNQLHSDSCIVLRRIRNFVTYWNYFHFIPILVRPLNWYFTIFQLYVNSLSSSIRIENSDSLLFFHVQCPHILAVFYFQVRCPLLIIKTTAECSIILIAPSVRKNKLIA